MTSSEKCIFNCEVCGSETEAATQPAPQCCQQPMVKQEPLPVCETSQTAEHSRFEDMGEPCDDGRGGN